MDVSPFPVPLTIISGFLGAGKTTLLNNILHGEHGLRVAVLVNDFGAINIDSQLVVGVEGEQMISLSNGCICCTIRDDLIGAVLRMLQQTDPPGYIIIEASGVSDPVAVAETFLLPALRPLLRLDSILTVVDADQFLDLSETDLWLAHEQVSVADAIVLNKVDLVDSATLDAVKSLIQRIVPAARIFETSYSRLPLELVLGAGAYDLDRLLEHPRRDIHVHEQSAHDDHHDEHDHDHDHSHDDHSVIFDSWSYHSDQPFDLDRLRDAVLNLPTSIYRAKGIIWLADVPDYPFELQIVGKRAMMIPRREWSERSGPSQFVVIGKPGEVHAEQLKAMLDQALADDEPAPIKVIRSRFELPRKQRT